MWACDVHVRVGAVHLCLCVGLAVCYQRPLKCSVQKAQRSFAALGSAPSPMLEGLLGEIL